MATEPEDEKDSKRAHVVLTKGHEVVRLGCSRVTSVAAKVTDKRENLGNHS
jgi:very-short-patch-repair endonuclease